jgi:hypothetical protein
VKDENVDLLADLHKILNSWKNYLCKSLNVNVVRDIGQLEMYTAELLVPSSSPFVVNIDIANLKRHNPPGSDQFPADLI